MGMKVLTVGNKKVMIFYMDWSQNSPVVYTHMKAGEAEMLVSKLQDRNLILAAVEGLEWERDLSPWPAPAAFKGGTDFTGGADLYLDELTGNIIPAVEKEFGFTPRRRIIAGYSLAGLFAVYAMCKSDCFSDVLSASGSFWYDGFLEFINENGLKRVPGKAYFSLGNKEAQTKNERMSVVGERTADLVDYFQGMAARTKFELNKGGHFDDPEGRMVKGIRWIIE